jgi:hypothetical protein
MMLHELWKDAGGQTFCFAGPLGDQARSMLDSDAVLIWSVEAESHYEAMTKYYEFMDWGVYRTEFEEDKQPYSPEWTSTQRT